MIASARNWLRRNRTNFAVGAGVLGAGYVAGRYVLSKVTETRQRMAEDRVAKENLRRRFQQNQEDCTITVLALLPTATENILEALPVEQITQDLQQKRAERLGRNASTPDSVAPVPSSGPSSVTDDDGKSLASLQAESYVHASQMTASSTGSGDAEASKPLKSKVQLWNEVKISSITRAFTLLYTLSLLTLLTRIQLNLLGRRNYLSSVVSMASHSPQDHTISLENRDDDNAEQAWGNDFETNRKFLTFSWWLLHRGWRQVMEKVETAVETVFGPLNPREDIPLERLSALILEVRRNVEGATPEERRSHKWLPYLLPPLDEEEFVLRESGMLKSLSTAQSASIPSPTSSPGQPSLNHPPPLPPVPTPLRRLLNETSDLIDSPPFTQILTLLLDTTFSHLTDQEIRTDAFKLPSPSSAGPRAQGLPELDLGLAKAKLANILAVLTRQAHAIGNGVPNRYAQAIEGVRELEAFAAVIYSSHFEFEALGDGGGGGVRSMEDGPEAPVEKANEKMVVHSATGMFDSVWEKLTGQ
ncbi:MAG: hypothetical protein LQ346_000221 [Caloplaca aetnensis]|nr:MAG: hypothetical protein LQ346_000221 [Caloplaca aetnensis]